MTRSFPSAARSVTYFICALFTCALFFAPRASAFNWYVFGGQVVVWPQGQSIRYLAPNTFDPEDIVFDQALGAMALWNIIPSTNFQYQYFQGTAEPGVELDGINNTQAVAAEDLDPGLLGITFLGNQGAQWYDMDVVFSDYPDNVGYNFDEFPTCDVIDNPTPINGYNFIMVAMHEFGHALGLGHDPLGDEPPGSLWFVATMNPRYPSGSPIGDENIIEIHVDDRSGLRFLYPPSGPSGPAYRDVANVGYVAGPEIGKAVPADAFPTLVSPDEDTYLPCTIENLGNTSEILMRQGFYLSTDPNIQTTDTFLGYLMWDLALGDALSFSIAATMPSDIAAGQYYVGSILDDQNVIPEEYEDNNVAATCQPITIRRLSPVIEPIGQQTAFEGVLWVGPVPQLTRPLNMAPTTWSIVSGPPGMTINQNTGRLRWNSPVHSDFLYVIIIRATNSAGNSTQTVFLGVEDCEGDADGNYLVNVNDITHIVFRLGQVAPNDNGADVDGNGTVNVNDITFAIFRLGDTCPSPP